uniref:NYN domain-containing protein n=1 Tax=Puniceibacterium confluentis TaxID=1958944 RepID=UPI003561B681
MKFSLLALFFSVAGILAALSLPGWSDLLLLAGPGAIASLILLVRARWPRIVRARPRADWVVVDGSNVMYWKDETPSLATVRKVVQHLRSEGLACRVFFDANVGYLVSGRYLNDRDLSRLLGVRRNRITVVPKGTPADPEILSEARKLGARVITNDRYRDWITAHPEIRTKGHLVQGEFRHGRLWL